MTQYCYENSFDFIALRKESWESPGSVDYTGQTTQLGYKANLNKLKRTGTNNTDQNLCPQCS